MISRPDLAQIRSLLLSLLPPGAAQEAARAILDYVARLEATVRPLARVTLPLMREKLTDQLAMATAVKLAQELFPQPA